MGEEGGKEKKKRKKTPKVFSAWLSECCHQRVSSACPLSGNPVNSHQGCNSRQTPLTPNFPSLDSSCLSFPMTPQALNHPHKIHSTSLFQMSPQCQKMNSFTLQSETRKKHLFLSFLFLFTLRSTDQWSETRRKSQWEKSQG